MRKILILFITMVLLCSCQDKIYYDPKAPVIEFSVNKTNAYGIPEYYIFDDNPEHLNSRFLADGKIPNSIVYFERLEEGIYTVFSYHHRGYSVEFSEDLYFDTVFYSNGCEITIEGLGLNHDWDWNQAWADFTGVPVFMPEMIKTYDCTCGRNPSRDNGECSEDCPALVKNQVRNPAYEVLSGMNRRITIEGVVFLSDIIKEIEESGMNHFRYGSFAEPMWLMMKFEILSGSTDFATVAYTTKEIAKNNFPQIGRGEYDNEPQYKGIASCAPFAVCEFDYTIKASGIVPVTVKNARVPDGYTIMDGGFATYVNTWRTKKPVAAESDMLSFEYKDRTKPALYGENAGNRNDTWVFDPFHTRLYGDNYDKNEMEILKKYGIKTGDAFVPNIAMSEILYPKGTEDAEYEFYRLAACNLGNFGVTTKYIMNVTNSSSKDADYIFEMKSDAGQVYRYRLTDENGKVISDDGGRYIMKKYDNDPAEDGKGGRIPPADYSTEVRYRIPSGETYTAELEVTTLTGCNAPMENRIRVEF